MYSKQVLYLQGNEGLQKLFIVTDCMGVSELAIDIVASIATVHRLLYLWYYYTDYSIAVVSSAMSELF